MVVFGTLAADPRKTATLILELDSPAATANGATFAIKRLLSPSTQLQQGYVKRASTHITRLKALAQLRDAALFFENVPGIPAA